MERPALKKLAQLNSYDLLKFFAVVTMIVDHLGYYFYPDDQWMRVIGRLSAPCWLFLVGYARTRDIPNSLLAGFFLVTGASVFLLDRVFPLDILLLVMICRLTMDVLARIALKNTESLVYSFLVLAVFSLPLYDYIEYSTFGVLIVLAGYAVRNRETIGISERAGNIFILSALFLYAAGMMLIFNIREPVMGAALLGGMVLLFGAFRHFRMVEFTSVTEKLPAPVTGLIRFCGHYNLHIYVGHLVLFDIIKVVMAYIDTPHG